MAITGNNSAEKTGREKLIYTGLSKCKVVAINPNIKELDAIGVTLKTEPQYVGEDGRVRIDFWVQPQEGGITKMSLWLENKLRESKAGKPQWINKYGKTGWAMTIEENLEWFLQDGARQAYHGEEDLHKLLQAFLNVKYDTKNKEYDECQLDTMEAIVKGNITELRDIFLGAYKDNSVRLLFGAKVTETGTYQNIFNKFFEKTWSENPNYTAWDAAANGEYGFKADFQDDWEFKVYVPSATTVSADVDVTTESEEEVF